MTSEQFDRIVSTLRERIADGHDVDVQMQHGKDDVTCEGGRQRIHLFNRTMTVTFTVDGGARDRTPEQGFQEDIRARPTTREAAGQ